MDQRALSKARCVKTDENAQAGVIHAVQPAQSFAVDHIEKILYYLNGL